MRQYPVDVARLGPLRFLSASPDSDEQGTQKVREGVPVWVVEVLHYPEGGRAEVERIKVVAPAAPEAAPLAPVRFRELVARPWSMGTRSGVALSAAGLENGPAKGGDRE